MKSALIIIDVQNGMFQMDPPVYEGKKLLQNLKKLISFARKNNNLIVYVQHNGPTGSPLEPGTEGWKIHKDIKPRETDIILTKNTPDCFYDTDLEAHLKKFEIEHFILSGIQTELCVDTTCRRGFSLDYAVTLVTDAHSTFDKAAISAQQIITHHNELLRWFSATKTVDETVSN